MLKKLYVALLAVMLCAGTAMAQGTIHMGLPVSVATGEFSQVSPQTMGAGFSFGAFFPVRNSGLEVGVEMAWLGYGIKRDELTLEVNGQTEEAIRNRSNSMFMFLPTVRYRIPTKSLRVSPFLEAQAGTRFVYTTHNIEVGDHTAWDCPETIDDRIEMAHWIGNFSVGAGVDYQTSDGTALTLRVLYQAGTRGDYARRGSFETDSKGNETVQFFNSRMDMITVSFGISGLLSSFMCE